MSADLGVKDKRFLQTLEFIDDKYIEDVFNVLKEPDMAETEYKKPSPFKYWKQYLAAAACILLLSFLIPTFSYVSEVIGSIVAGTGANTTEMTEDFESREETLNGIESTEEQNVTEPTPDFPYSNVKIIADNNASINPVSVLIGYTWYKYEKSVLTEEIGGWQYIIYNEKYGYENLPHLTLERRLTSSLPENVTISSFMVYSTDWKKTEYSFDDLYELSNLPAGDYIIVGIEKEKIPYDKPHFEIGEYDYKLDKSAIVFGLTVTDPIVYVNELKYLKFIPELEEIDYDTMIEVQNAWGRFKPNALFNDNYFSSYGYLGTARECVVIAKYYYQQREPISMELVYDHITEIYVYTNGTLISIQEAHERGLLTYDDIAIFEERSKEYYSFSIFYLTKNPKLSDK